MARGHSEALESLFVDPAFGDLLNGITTSTVNWSSFMDMELPQGFTVNDTWALIHLLNQKSGTNLPPFAGDAGIFYRYSNQMIGRIVSLYRIASDTASLGMYRDVCTSEQLGWTSVRDCAAAARLDGVLVDDEVLLGAWDARSKRIVGTVEGAGNQLVLNSLPLSDSAPALAQRPLTGSTIIDLARGVYEGVKADELAGCKSVRTPVVPAGAVPEARAQRSIGMSRLDALLDSHDALARADAVAAYLEGSTGEGTDLDLLRMLLAGDMVATFVPLGCAASLVGRVVRKIMAYRLGLDVAGWLPLDCLRLEWERGLVDAGLVPFTREDVAEQQRHETGLGLFDITQLQTVNLELFGTELARFVEFINAKRVQNEVARKALKDSAYFNQRQCAVLARALGGFDNTFTIRYHEKNNLISYATARRDFQELCDAGLLAADYSGNTQVFRAAPDLDSVLARMIGVESIASDVAVPARYLPPESLTHPRPAVHALFASH